MEPERRVAIVCEAVGVRAPRGPSSSGRIGGNRGALRLSDFQWAAGPDIQKYFRCEVAKACFTELYSVERHRKPHSESNSDETIAR